MAVPLLGTIVLDGFLGSQLLLRASWDPEKNDSGGSMKIKWGWYANETVGWNVCLVLTLSGSTPF